MTFDLLNYMYYELTLGIIFTTMVINKLFAVKKYIDLKWLTLVVAAFGGVVHYLTHDDSDIWKIIISFGLAVLGYDYFVKVISDKYQGKNPLT